MVSRRSALVREADRVCVTRAGRNRAPHRSGLRDSNGKGVRARYLCVQATCLPQVTSRAIVPTRPQEGAIGTGIIKLSIVGWDLFLVTSDNLASCAVPSLLYLTVARPACMQAPCLSRAVRLRPPASGEGGRVPRRVA